MWAAFTTAGFTFWCPAPVTVRPAPEGTATGPFPLRGPATFVTADNPQGALGSEDENRARRAALAAYLDGRDLVWHPALGGDPNGDHLEPGALVLGLDMSSAAALGARFDQAAVYVWTPAALHLLACTEPRREILGYRVISRPSALPPPPLRPPPPAGTSGPGDPQKNCR